MKPDKLLRRIQTDRANVRFGDFVRLIEALGFELDRHDGGSHRIYVHPKVPKHLNLQDYGGQAKPYQIKKLLQLVDAYSLRIERP
ncbi:MAG: type II toxin-antitoxin system HicA family toxin [Phycisphaeraceae bacterium]|nr:type II toxin-antitoxin system HicA family toxin [Phycisphaeraceae bacterium]